jgi:cellulose biosynthesis protein BcsQ
MSAESTTSVPSDSRGPTRRQPGRIVTFYSYKGGVGRSFALANIAILLARLGKRVLIVDFDLEAPGIERYFHDYSLASRPSSPRSHDKGLLHLLTSHVAGEQTAWRDLVQRITIRSSDTVGPITGSIHLLPSGCGDPSYASLLHRFSWGDFFAKHDGALFFDRLRIDWTESQTSAETFDLILIDSRTGLTDHGSVCTILLPDFLVLCFTTARQSLDGILDVFKTAQAQRLGLPFVRPPLTILPLLCRFDGREEYDAGQEWLAILSEELKECYANWLPKRFSARRMLEATKLPYIAKFSFGERLPVLEQGVTDPDSIGSFLNASARLLATDFSEATAILDPTAVTEKSNVPADVARNNQVFVSYRHDNAAHAASVREFAERLRSSGIPVMLDQLFLEANPGGPDEGWPRWAERQVDKAACVLAVVSQGWASAFRNNSPRSEGLGAASEGAMLAQMLYESGGANRNLRTVVLKKEDMTSIPPRLQAYHVFQPNESDRDFRQLVQWLAEKTGVALPSSTRELDWPSPNSNFEPMIADRVLEWQTMKKFCSGQIIPRIVTIAGPAGIGKTTLIHCSARYSETIGLAMVVVSSRSWRRTWSEIANSLRPLLPDIGSDATPLALRTRLRSLTKPVILAFDDYELATDELKEEFIRPLIEEVDRLPGLGIIVSGRDVPISKATRLILAAPSTDDWILWAKQSGLNVAEEQMRTISIAANGEPSIVSSLVNSLSAHLAQ